MLLLRVNLTRSKMLLLKLVKPLLLLLFMLKVLPFSQLIVELRRVERRKRLLRKRRWLKWWGSKLIIEEAVLLLLLILLILELSKLISLLLCHVILKLLLL